jgi:hypothetical protein
LECHEQTRTPSWSRIDFLCASGADIKAIAKQFGLSYPSVLAHYRRHLSVRYKRIVGASRLESCEALLSKAAEGDAATLDILALWTRGHTQAWALALDAGSAKDMSLHAARVLQAAEFRAKITRELTGTPTIQVNTILTADAAQLVQVLEHFPDAAEAVLRWHERRNDTRVIEHNADRAPAN